jgi:hypothetical protein
VRFVSDNFKAAVRASHQLATRCDLLIGGQPKTQGLPLAESAGSVTLDRTAAVRGRAQVTLAAPELIPQHAFDPLTPFGAELQLWRGVQLSAGPELVSLGVFPIQDLGTDATGGEISLTLLDRAQRVIDAGFETTEVIAAGTPVPDAIQTLISNGVPGLTFRFVGSSEVTPLLVYDPGSSTDRWAAAQALAASIGCDLYFDGVGACVLVPIPDPSSGSVWDFTDGPKGVVVSLAKKWDRGPAYNAVIGTSSGTGTPITAVARDLDPTSPSYYFGPFGRKPISYQAPFTSSTQAQNAVNAKLRQGLGVAQSLDLSVVPNPALEPGDIVAVRRTLIGVDEVDVLDSTVIPLDAASSQTAGVRARQIAA